MMTHQSVTIEDVAKAAHVSRQTVSRVINHSKNVSTSSFKKVKQAIDDLGYVPSLAARRMGGSRSFVLMALMERGSDLPLGDILSAGIDACSPRGFHVIFEHLEAPSPSLQFEEAEARIAKSLTPALSALQPDGIVILPSLDHCSPLLSALKKREIAFACLSQRKEFGRLVPGIDDAAFVEVAAQKLVDLGHRQVGFVPCGSDANRSQRRIEGYRRKLAQVGSRAQRHFVASPVTGGSAAIAQAKSWLTPTIRPTGIITETAQTALAFLQVARELKIEVPRELSIISLEDTPVLADEMWSISALDLPYDKLFATACERLMEAENAPAEQGLRSAFLFEDRGSIDKAPRSV